LQIVIRSQQIANSYKISTNFQEMTEQGFFFVFVFKISYNNNN